MLFSLKISYRLSNVIQTLKKRKKKRKKEKKEHRGERRNRNEVKEEKEVALFDPRERNASYGARTGSAGIFNYEAAKKRPEEKFEGRARPLAVPLLERARLERVFVTPDDLFNASCPDQLPPRRRV